MGSPEGASTNAAEDGVLLAAIASGDELSLRRLYERYAGLLLHVAHETAGSWEAAEEVVQDVFVQCWLKAGTYRPERGTVAGWLVGMTRNRSIDHVRHSNAGKRARNLTVPLDGLTAMPHANGAGPGSRLERSDVAEAWQVLSTEERTAILLAVHGGLTQVEIADVLGAPLGTVKSWMRRGMQRLRTQLQAMGHGHD